MTIPNRDLHLTNIGNLAQALLTTAANLNMEVDHLTRQPPTGDGQTGSEDWQQQRTEMETELARLRETNAHQRTQLADYHRVYNENKASHELLESRVQELLKRWSNDVANRDQQLRIRSVHRFWNWLGKTCAMVNPKSVTVLCEAYSVLLREGAPTAPQTNDIVKIPPFTAKASAPVYAPAQSRPLTPQPSRPNGKSAAEREVSSSGAGDDGRPSKRAKSTPVSPKLKPSGNEFKRISKNPRTSLSQHPSVQSVPGFTQEMLDVYEEVRATKLWERYRRVGSILPDRDGPEGQHVRRFNTSVATFWDRYGQQLWERTYAPFGNANHLEPLFHQVFNLHVELQLLINNTDYDDTLVHFLCFPHPAWPVLSLNPPTPKKILAGDPGWSAIVMDYWVNRSVRFWPEVPPIPHSGKTGNEVWYRLGRLYRGTSSTRGAHGVTNRTLSCQ
ncbi:hypothetical protein H257_16908 [Aphanomyces astaci]|uniref:Uncharacterized protein n=1 Tax=Aphanomyces astaci TaxID=112090 RepID=W4FIY9_APHAT|nr:hypothetical protein H257_16908 [Aphanomyces astaci]ETV66698.1 hypothetical protein H257_16908 [Aphanomyces astaci]|eukprot:XP_009843823.1 hypothetical protein H257_16908 [Aphanomyces astaci]